MADFKTITDDLLARARTDRALRCQILTEHLDVLLASLGRLRASSGAAGDPARAAQIKDGVELAVRLADLLHAAGGAPHVAGGAPRRPAS